MSLLLDALKKAAQDKIARSDPGARSDPKSEGQDGPRRKIARTDSAARNNTTDDGENSLHRMPGESADQAVPERESIVPPGQEDAAAVIASDFENDGQGVEDFEFTLDEQPAEAVQDPAADTQTGRAGITGEKVDSGSLKKEKRRSSVETAGIAAMHTTITDEALQLLIRKSNVEHRKRQYSVWGSVFGGSVVVLILAGLYFYFDMEDEIDAMQIRNRQALAALAAQTKIEEHLTSLATPVAKPARLKSEARTRTTAPKQPAGQAVSQKQTFSVRRTEKHDPVNVLLSRGWSAFQSGDYDIADKAYSEVLQREARNRDAMLGMAAVADKRGETEKARDYYLRLLQLDPLDPYAHAGLASIAQTDGASLSENRLRQLIDKQPDSAQLQFVLGNFYAGQGKWPQAQQAYFSALQGDRQNADYAFNLAVSLDHLKQYSEAQRFYISSLDLAHNRITGFSVDEAETRLQQLRALNK